MIYFDYAASHPLSESMAREIGDFYLNYFANSAAKHSLAKKEDQEIEAARDLLLEAFPKESKLYFCSSATEANNWFGESVSGHFKPSALELDHPSLVKVVEHHQGQTLKEVEFASPNEVHAKLSPEVNLLCLSPINGQSGFHFNRAWLDELRSLRPKLHYHLDLSQSWTKLPHEYLDLDNASFTLSSHKMGGPKGVACLIVPKNFPLKAWMIGGGHQDGMRSSTMNTPLILGLKKAYVESHKNTQDKFDWAKDKNTFLREEIEKICKNVIFPFPLEKTSPYILSFIVPGVSSDILLRHFEEKQVFLSSSSACSSKVKGFNQVFQSLGIEEKYHKNVLRLSFGKTSTDSEFGDFIKIFHEIWDDISFLIKA